MSDAGAADFDRLLARWRANRDVRSFLLAEAAEMEGAFDWLIEGAGSLIGTDNAAAAEMAEFAAATASLRSDLPGEAAAWRRCGQALRASGRHEEAVASFRSAADAAARGGDALLAAQVQIGSVGSLGMLGRIDEAIELAQRLEARLKSLGAGVDAAKALANRGGLNFRRDSYLEAWECYSQAAELLRPTGDQIALARVMTNEANALIYLDRVDEALRAYEEARSCFVAQGMAFEAAVVDVNLGYWYLNSGAYVQAIGAFGGALAAFRVSERPQDAALAQLGRAEAYRGLNLLEESLSDYAEAIDLLERCGLLFDLGRAELGRAAIRLALDQPALAGESLDRAERLFRAQKNPLRCAQVDLLRARLLHRNGNFEESWSAARRAERIFTRKRLPGWSAEARLLLAQGLQDRDVLHRLRAVVGAARRRNNGWLECRAEHALGQAYTRLGDRGRALRHFRRAVQALESVSTQIAPEEMHAAFLRDKLGVYTDPISLLLQGADTGDLEEAFDLAERSRSRALLLRLQDSLEQRESSAGAESQTTDLSARLADLSARLNRAYQSNDGLDEPQSRRLAPLGPEVTPQALRELERRYHDTLLELESAKAPLRIGSVRPPDLADVQAALSPGETLLEYHFTGDDLHAFIISREGLFVLPRISSRDAIARSARRLRYHIDRAGAVSDMQTRSPAAILQGIMQVLSQLYDLLLRPVEHHLKGERVVLVPHDLIHGLPFHALHDGRIHALDRWEFLVSPSAAIWMEDRRARASSGCESALIMGAPAPGIEHVMDEVANLAALIPGATLLSCEDATVEAFRRLAPSYNTLHLAMHAQYRLDNPLFSGLRFHDDWLLARDLYGITLDCDLATLSACRTGEARIDAGDEIFGLVRGFLVAGCRAVAASLWPADDIATSTLMARFYTEMRGGRSLPEALRKAQQETRKLYPHPYYWAAFMLVGTRCARAPPAAEPNLFRGTP